MRILRRTWNDERGIALMVALAATIVLGIAITAIIAYTTSNQKSTNLTAAEQSAQQVAEAGMQQAYAIINYQTTVSGGNPAAANLLGCWGATGVSDPAAPSDCSSVHLTPKVFCISAASPCTSGTAGTASVYGCYIGNSSQKCDMNGTEVAVPSADWLISSTGYARNPNTGKTVGATVTATVNVQASELGLQSSVWNYLFSSAPAGSGCELDVNGQNVEIDVPIFVTGDFCLSGQGAGVVEDIQKVDVQVMGKTVFSGTNTYVGSSSAPITSGVSAGGCASSIDDTGSACSGFDWHVKSTDAVPSSQPTAPVPDFTTAYSTAGVGPAYGCNVSGTLTKSTFDNDSTQNNSAPAFDLTPSTSYSCVSTVTVNGVSKTSKLIWDATTKNLTVQGDIYFDGSAYVSQEATYDGTANLYLSGTFYFTGQTSGLCATTIQSQKPYCDFSSTAWQTSNDMLLIMPDDMANVQKAVALDGQNNFLQAGILAPPTATISLGGNNVNYQGPIIGGKYTWGNNVNLQPMPPLTNMPPGAPVDPNVSVKIGSLGYTG